MRPIKSDAEEACLLNHCNSLTIEIQVWVTKPTCHLHKTHGGNFKGLETKAMGVAWARMFAVTDDQTKVGDA